MTKWFLKQRLSLGTGGHKVRFCCTCKWRVGSEKSHGIPTIVGDVCLLTMLLLWETVHSTCEHVGMGRGSVVLRDCWTSWRVSCRKYVWRIISVE